MRLGGGEDNEEDTLDLWFLDVSVPENEDFFALEDVFVVDDLFSEDISVVRDLSPHVIDKEWLSEIVFVVWVWHSLKVKSHHGSWLNISDLVAASGGVHIRVEVASNWLAVLWEERVVKTLVEFLIKIDNVVGLWSEEFTKFLIGEKSVEKEDLINGWLSSFVSNASGSDNGGEGEVEFPDHGIWHHVEGESSISKERSSPSVVWSVKSVSNLIEIVTCSLSPLPVVIGEDVSLVLELSWISLGACLPKCNH